jgi:broad specificity phosphatase PhoE
MPIKITYFVHGTTMDNEKDLATGWLDGELSEKGLKQAKELGDLVNDQHFDVVFCSDLKRAVDSAELGFGNKYQIIKDKRLRECNYGDFTQTPSDDFKSMNQMLDYVEKSFPNGESYRDVENRMADFIDFLKQNYSGKHIAIVAHQGPQLALEVLANKKTWEQAIRQDWRKAKSWQPGWEYIIE